MAQYKLKFGTHQQEGRVYRAGELIATGWNLLEMFPNKFELVGEDTPPPVATVSEPPTPTPIVPIVEEELPEVTPPNPLGWDEEREPTPLPAPAVLKKARAGKASKKVKS